MKRVLAGLAVIGLFVGCGDTATPTPAPSCVPDRAQWNATMRATVERSCGACHGATPNYGAPYSLLDYDFITRTMGAQRPVDRMHARLMDGSMPPAGTPAPTFADAQSIVGWASCGTRTLVDDNRMRATAPLFVAPAQPPAGTTSVELRADNFEIPQVSDRYQCFEFSNIVAADRFARRFDIILDHPEVLHHVVLFKALGASEGSSYECQGSPPDTLYTYTWAPGQDALQFPEGGLRIRPGDRYILQFHYNNSRNLTGIRDRSGVRISVGEPTGTEYGMVAIGPLGFSIPARSEQRVASACTLPVGTRVLASMPHMHEVGTTYEQTLLRGGARTPIVGITNWRFESQYFYDHPLTIQAGDRIETACTFNNTTSRAVTNGSRTTDEMCFGFTYVTPPPPSEYCNEPLVPPMPLPDVTYTPGTCSPADAPRELPLVRGGVRVGTPAPLMGGTIPDGRWELSGMEYVLNMTSTPLGNINAMESTLQGRGQVWTSAGRVRADIVGAMGLVLGTATRLDRPLPQINFNSTYTASSGTMTLTTECMTGTAAQTPSSLDYEVRGDDLVVGLRAQALGSVSIAPRYTFHRVP